MIVRTKVAVLCLVISPLLSACGSPNKSASSVDACREVKRITGKFADSSLKNLQQILENPDQTSAPAIPNLAQELRDLAKKLPIGEKRDYVLTLANDFEKATNDSSSLEGILTLGEDLLPAKIQIVCPK